MENLQFAEMLMRTRLRSGITQQQLADLSTISSRAIRNLEKGHVRHPRKETVQLLADALRIDGSTRYRLLKLAVEGEREGPHGSPGGVGPPDFGRPTAPGEPFHDAHGLPEQGPRLSGSSLGQGSIPLTSPASTKGTRPDTDPGALAGTARPAAAGTGADGDDRDAEPAGAPDVRRPALTCAYEYRAVPLPEGSGPGATGVLTEVARDGWRLAAVDGGTAYMERRTR
ncbi:XRE family transcriptional regulator [Streptomyces alfalfae]|uniref:Helix-turn-helix transcriptional regulator n=2 Tax=Streptomyces alfalfae TaxID=1642299 RepID=A0A4Q7F5V5_9ACTN|nr:helix-turn-helix transcriptional regulator [Streptomyces alfalfae]QQC92992.1 helix-turn-helix transcriptional regulator [Streptomyces alfalfae]RXX35028.1 XRE family transcriptional regulator [Streptomyces alfalfae]RXX45764.1 XRE family transcriptional regulator [Streptomyces alfalfae]RXX47899.1 XRE family transcriptional regulator [Streptomyces alfalfae]RZN01697.1 XRE family transcriptional regulator [Streptomyces alfalfae]